MTSSLPMALEFVEYGRHQWGNNLDRAFHQNTIWFVGESERKRDIQIERERESERVWPKGGRTERMILKVEKKMKKLMEEWTRMLHVDSLIFSNEWMFEYTRYMNDILRSILLHFWLGLYYEVGYGPMGRKVADRRIDHLENIRMQKSRFESAHGNG